MAEREVVRVDAGAVPVYLDIAQLGRVLELSLGQRRQRDEADAFLARMPALSRIIEQDGTDNSEDSLFKRKIEVYLSGVFGTLTLGYGPTVSDGTSEADLSGTKLAGKSKSPRIAGAFF